MGVMRACLRGAFCLLGLWSALAWAQPGERTHTVQRKETAFGIARQYGVDLNALYGLNPWAEEGLRKGDVLRIPQPLAPQPETVPPVPAQPEVVDSVPPVVDAVGEAPVVQELPRVRPVPPTWPMDTIQVAVFLPFSAEEDSLGRQALRLREIALDCAAGVRLALDSGRAVGAPVDVRFFDTGLDTAGVMRCSAASLDTLEFNVDLAIGPLRRPAFEAVRTWPRMAGAAHLVLTDLGPRMAEEAPGVLFPYTQPDSRMALLAQRVAESHAGERVMMLASGDIRNLEAEDAFRAAWAATEVDSTTTLVEVEVTSRGLGSLRDSLTDVRRNILVVPGGKASRSFAGVLQTEIQLGDTMDFVLYADGPWRDFEFLDLGLMGEVDLTVAAGGGAPADSISGEVKSDSLRMARIRRLSILRGGPVGRYGVLAHDVVRNALLWRAGHGSGWAERLAAGVPLVFPGAEDGIAHDFDWTAPWGPESGLINGHARLLYLQDLQWIENGRPAPSPLLPLDALPDE